ncbi:MAG TPA: hypothetical protein VM677_09295 [Actinokineospora sp.]|jgi:hypothetical protein|nr:hypothetical protein [Actinokineospora sp.]
MVYALIATILVAAVSVTARWGWAKDAAFRALRDRNPKSIEWRGACFLARLLVPAVLAVILVVLIGAALDDGPLSATNWAIALAVVTGVIGNHVDREVAGGWGPFWLRCHDSLREVLPVFMDVEHVDHGTSAVDCQALQYNLWHKSLLSADSRPIALARIFGADPHPSD